MLYSPILFIAFLSYLAVPTTAVAQTSDTAISLKPFIDMVVPYLAAMLAALVSAAITVVTNAVYRWTGFQVEARQREALHSAAMTAAASIWAKADARIATMKIDPKSELIKSSVDWIVTVGAPKAVANFGLTPDELALLVTSKLGILQAEAAVSAPAVAPPQAPASTP